MSALANFSDIAGLNVRGCSFWLPLFVFSVNAIHTRFEDESYFKGVDDVTIRVSLGLLAMVFCLVS
jgi:hypothetical protein